MHVMCSTHDSLTARGLLISEEADADKVTKIGSTCFSKLPVPTYPPTPSLDSPLAQELICKAKFDIDKVSASWQSKTLLTAD